MYELSLPHFPSVSASLCLFTYSLSAILYKTKTIEHKNVQLTCITLSLYLSHRKPLLSTEMCENMNTGQTLTLLPTVAMTQKNKSLCAVFSFCTVENMYYLCSYLKEIKSDVFKQNDLCWEASENSNLHLPHVFKKSSKLHSKTSTHPWHSPKKVRWGGGGGGGFRVDNRTHT